MSNKPYKAMEIALQVLGLTTVFAIVSSILLGVYAFADVVL